MPMGTNAAFTKKIEVIMSKNTFCQGYKAGGVFVYNNFTTRMNEVEKNAENLPVRTEPDYAGRNSA